MKKGIFINPEANIAGINYKDIVDILPNNIKVLGKTVDELLKLSSDEIVIRKTNKKKTETGKFSKEFIISKCVIADLQLLK